jgi:hypothetical protein
MAIKRYLGILAALILLAVLLARFSQPRPVEPMDASVLQAITPAEPSLPVQPLPGDQILANYGSATSTAKQDLDALALTLANYSILVKGPTPLPLGANEEVAAALLGKNRIKMPFITAKCPALNDSGQLIDRWGTPLFFHAESADRLDLRSAGPDQNMWTADDLHRAHDGSYLSPEKLNPPSLHQPSSLDNHRPSR